MCGIKYGVFHFSSNQTENILVWLGVNFQWCQKLWNPLSISSIQQLRIAIFIILSQLEQGACPINGVLKWKSLFLCNVYGHELEHGILINIALVE